MRYISLQRQNRNLTEKLQQFGWKSAEFRADKQDISEIIIQKVCQYYGCTIEQMATKSRRAYDVRRRNVLTAFLHEDALLTLKQIGAILGGRDHTTILYAIKEMNNRKNNPLWGEFEDYQAIKKILFKSIRHANLK